MSFNVAWHFNIPEMNVLGRRMGFERFKDGNDIYEIAQWFPRMAAYYDAAGWQNEQYLGDGEFTLEFGDYDVAITVPGDHIVAATGELQNAGEVLTQHPARAPAAGENRRQAGDDRVAGRSAGNRKGPRHQQPNLALQRQERARLRVRVEPQVHLGCAGHQEWQAGRDGDVVLPGRSATRCGKNTRRRP